MGTVLSLDAARVYNATATGNNNNYGSKTVTTNERPVPPRLTRIVLIARRRSLNRAAGERSQKDGAHRFVVVVVVRRIKIVVAEVNDCRERDGGARVFFLLLPPAGRFKNKK